MSRSWLIIPLVILYLLDLGGIGFVSADEPRYASVGREMAVSRDFITPHLDGQPWFEKPPLLYWAIAIGRATRLPDEWAARLPVALMSLAFLIFFFNVLSREFSPRTAIAATSILATSAGWLAYSFVAVTDLPMSAALFAAILIALFDTRRDQGYFAGILLGLAILAKGFVPLVLFLPMFLLARGKRLTMIAGCIVIAAPWYLLVSLRNGHAFWNEFFWKHHIERLLTASLQHVQPFWYYIPVLLAGLFPWTPLAGLLVLRKTYDDVRVRFLTAWLLYAFLFFSIAKNKLPGYVLPLMPALAIVLAFGLEKTGTSLKWWLAIPAVTLMALPAVAAALPAALLSGIRKAPIVFTPGVPFLLVAAGVWWLAWREKPSLAILTIAMAIVFGVSYIKGRTFPLIDERVSVRHFWQTNRAQAENACIDSSVRREWQYGLNYYAGRPLPECEPNTTPRIVASSGKLVLQTQ